MINNNESLISPMKISALNVVDTVEHRKSFKIVLMRAVQYITIYGKYICNLHLVHDGGDSLQ